VVTAAAEAFGGGVAGFAIGRLGTAASGLGGHVPSLLCAALATLLRLGQMARSQFMLLTVACGSA